MRNIFSLRSKKNARKYLPSVKNRFFRIIQAEDKVHVSYFLMFLFWSLPTTFLFDVFCLKEYLGLKFEKTILSRVPTSPGLP